jgi:hypothetical protein
MKSSRDRGNFSPSVTLARVIEIELLFLIKLDHGPVRDDHVAAVLVSAGFRIAPLARHSPLKETAAIVKLAAEQLDKIVNAALALQHESLKVPECNFIHG